MAERLKEKVKFFFKEGSRALACSVSKLFGVYKNYKPTFWGTLWVKRGFKSLHSERCN